MFEKMVQWSKQNYSHLPWRINRNLYSTLVSEIMLQQTTVATVLNHYERFMQEYPTLLSLAGASDEELAISWKGLGYYRRARNLKKACARFAKDFNGEIPLDQGELLNTPGIGPYTANALLAIGADQPYLCIDANLERILSRVYNLKSQQGPKLLKEINTQYASGKICQEMHILGGRAFNEALMDLGRYYCRSKNPKCYECPLLSICQAAQKRKVDELPVKKKTEQVGGPINLSLLRLVVEKNNQILVYQKNNDEWLSGQWEIPTYVMGCEDETLKQYPLLEKNINYEWLPSFKTGITKYQITNYILHCNEKELRELGISIKKLKWIESCGKNQNLSTATIKALNL